MLIRVIALLVLALVMVSLTFGKDNRMDSLTFVVGSVSLGWIVFEVASARYRIVLDDDWLSLRGLLRTRDIPRQEVTGLELLQGPSGPRLMVRLQSGRVRRLRAEPFDVRDLLALEAAMARKQVHGIPVRQSKAMAWLYPAALLLMGTYLILFAYSAWRYQSWMGVNVTNRSEIFELLLALAGGGMLVGGIALIAKRLRRPTQ